MTMEMLLAHRGGAITNWMSLGFGRSFGDVKARRSKNAARWRKSCSLTTSRLIKNSDGPLKLIMKRLAPLPMVWFPARIRHFAQLFSEAKQLFSTLLGFSLSLHVSGVRENVDTGHRCGCLKTSNKPQQE